MAERQTEAVHSEAAGLDTRAPHAALRLLAEGQIEAAKSVLGAIDSIAAAADLVARQLLDGGRLIYTAAGSSALMALADALELPGTFGIPQERVVVAIAGGVAALSHLAGGPEDSEEQGAAEVVRLGLGEQDCLIVVSASGSTPYALGAIREAKARSVPAIAFANNANTPLLDLATVPVVLATPPEVIAGSTRMGAGTAQKIALNMLSTLAAIKLGHVHDGYMVNLRADNLKLRQRAARIVAAIAGCDEQRAAAALFDTEGAVKAAIILAAGAESPDAARQLLEKSSQHLRPALEMLAGADRPSHWKLKYATRTVKQGE